jgi:DNA-directed RNA polymerase specialized sigma24 family protein
LVTIARRVSIRALRRSRRAAAADILLAPPPPIFEIGAPPPPTFRRRAADVAAINCNFNRIFRWPNQASS